MNPSTIFQVPTLISKVMTMADGGIRIQLDTRELAPEETSVLFALKGKEVWAAMKELEVRLEDIKTPEFAPALKTVKSPSQRLRSVLYVYWQQSGGKGDFETYYRQQIEKIIETIKGKLI